MNENLNLLSISFYLNDKECDISVNPDMTALTLLKNVLGFTGLKESCSEGDCGACTIAIGELKDSGLTYRAFNSCILPAAKLHGKHVITIEGLSDGEKLHIIQEMMLENHAVQCGYCTPGIIMSLFCLFSRKQTPDESEIFQALEGNLCRCTGYESVRLTGKSIISKIQQDIDKWKQIILPAYVSQIEKKMHIFEKKIEYKIGDNYENRDTLGYFLPQNLPELYNIMDKIKDCKSYRIVNGSTDIMVDVNIKRAFPVYLIDISGIKELNFIQEKDEYILIGANTTLTQILESSLIQEKLLVLSSTVSKMSCTQIRNTATLAGNIANASPIADGAVALLGLDSQLVMLSKNGERRIPVEKFYKDYKMTDICPHEIIGRIEIPVLKGFYSFEKSAKRTALDIASVNSLCFLQTKNNIISDCRFAFGGIAKFPVLAKKCTEYLLNKNLEPEIIQKAANIAAEEFKPISDIRGSADFRRLLIKNNIIKHLYKFLKIE